MGTREHPLTPLAAVAGGLVAGVAGTAVMDALLYARYRRSGGQDAPLTWEFPPIESWQQASDPGQVARRVIEGFTQRKLPDRLAWPVSTAMHWAYGTGSAALYGIVVGSLRQPRAVYGPWFGAAVWAASYVILPEGGLYKPIWEYDAQTLAWDLTGHLAYGAGTGVTFLVLATALE